MSRTSTPEPTLAEDVEKWVEQKQRRLQWSNGPFTSYDYFVKSADLRPLLSRLQQRIKELEEENFNLTCDLRERQ